MKFLIICLIILLSLSVGLVSVTQGQTLNNYPSLVEVSLQLQIRDSEGLLVAYYEPTQIYPVDIELVHEFLDTKENKTTIYVKDGRDLEVIKWEQRGVFRESILKTAFGIYKEGELALVVFQDGFLSEPGDTFTASWKVARPSINPFG